MKMKKIFFNVLLIAFLSAILGLGFNARLIKRYAQGEFRHGFLSVEEYSAISFITLPEAEDLFAGQLALFVDSRASEAFREGHIVGAVSIPYEEPSEILLGEDFPAWPERTIVIYCDGSQCQSSIGLAKLLLGRGFKDLKVFYGGWEEWLGQGLPITRENDQ